MRQLRFQLAILLFPMALAAASFAQEDAELGQAAFYANSMQGKKTSSGELYDKDKLTAAHRTLPIGSVVRVTRMDNKKTVEVRINDCGPFTGGRIVDLSRAAAEKIGLIQDGVTQVKLEVITLGTGKPACGGSVSSLRPKKQAADTKPAEKPAEAATPPPPMPTTPTADGTYRLEALQPLRGGFVVQVASFSNRDTAHKKAEEVKAKGLGNVLLSFSGKLTRVMLGPFETREQAKAFLATLKKQHRMDGFVTTLPQ